MSEDIIISQYRIKDGDYTDLLVTVDKEFETITIEHENSEEGNMGISIDYHSLHPLVKVLTKIVEDGD